MTDPIDISAEIWDQKYRLRQPDGRPVEETIADTWQRVARALAVSEADPEGWAERFFEIMDGYRYLPAGRILAGAGTGRAVTLFNCFVMGQIPDDMGGIFDHLREAALTMQQGGGIGYDFSTLRPKGAPVHGVGADASGPLSFMDVWDSMCRTIMSAGSRRGAMMATMRCDHPDIEAFVDAKKEAGRLRMFNLSVLVTDRFVRALDRDSDWDLVFEGRVYRTVRARALWDRITRATYDYAEPGVIFIDRINALNNLNYCETISATNPCGEQPLPPYGACLLGSVNLARLVLEPFTGNARLDTEALARIVPVAVRMMDNVIDVSSFPLPEQRAEAQAKRRIGLGVTGLADALIQCGVSYASEEAVRLTRQWLEIIRNAAYRASIDLASEKGPFPLFDARAYLERPMIQALDDELRADIARHGVRNALLTSIAPTGTISLLAGNVSSGIEPVFAYEYDRTVLLPDGSRRKVAVQDYAYRLFREQFGPDAPLPPQFVDVAGLAPAHHLAIQAAAQPYVDSSISKTINCPPDLSFEGFKDVYTEAYRMGLKGCTTYRPNAVTGAVLETRAAAEPEPGETPAEMPAAAAGAAGGAAGGGEESLGTAGSGTAGGYGLLRPAHSSDGGVVYMTRPLDRPEDLPGKTYKLRWPDSDHAIYVTINDIAQDGAGGEKRWRPFEVFINSKNMEHYAWTVALTRMISAVFRRGGDVAFVVEELKAVFDPRGGHWMKGRYVPSLLAAIGEIIERHMVEIGFLPADRLAPPDRQLALEAEAEPEAEVVNAEHQPRHERPGRQCPKCGAASLVRSEGCDLCPLCGYSKCS
ncbi:MAG: adenosylcobalamin-dependent ribonucleoside-diphosphate reductase [Alphaproteobacteria bacterium]|jgi:ribonucleoside-diphosphate reductase alpha chain|nr:adenosylcobalamin-dependent ribonucleoside-diphosphate reductase [Alphaproteobacteria bacterium]